jgi:hypothetical protein
MLSAINATNEKFSCDSHLWLFKSQKLKSQSEVL